MSLLGNWLVVSFDGTHHRKLNTAGRIIKIRRGNILLNWFNRNRGVGGVVGIENHPQGLAVAHVTSTPEGVNQLLSCDFLPCDEQAARPALLREHIHSLDLKGAACNMVLPMQDYSLQLTEAPTVPPAELHDAVRWRISDSLPMPVEDAVVDVFALPDDTNRNNMVYAVAAHRENIDKNVALAKSAGLKLKAIDIAELSMRNLCERFAQPGRSTAIVWLEAGRASLTLTRDGSLYLTRTFDINWNGGLIDDLPADALTLEMQRSLDYFERQMRQPPPQQIFLCGANMTDDKIPGTLRDSLSAQVNVLPLQERFALSPAIDTENLQRCLNAIGAALRIDEEAA